MDLYSPTTLFQSSIRHTGTLSPGPNTLIIQRAGTKNASSCDDYIAADVFEVMGTLICP